MSGGHGSSISRFYRGSILFILILLFLCFFVSGTASAATLSDTLRISTGGSGCASIGTWDTATKTCLLTDDITMTADVSALDVYGDGIAIDGGGHRITGQNSNPFSTAAGVIVDGRQSVTVRNLDISGFHTGIRLADSNFGMIINNNVHDNSRLKSGTESCRIFNDLYGYAFIDLPYMDQTGLGIEITGSGNNYISMNIVSGNGGGGISLTASTFNVVSGNGLTGNNSSHSHYTCPAGEVDFPYTPPPPTATTTGDGIRLTDAGFNTLNNNAVTAHTSNGIHVGGSASPATSGLNGIAFNSISSNGTGLYLQDSGYQDVRRNNFTANGSQIMLLDSAGDIFGGNYFDDWSGSGAYVFPGGSDPAPGDLVNHATMGRPALSLRQTGASWGSYSAYLARQLSVGFEVRNDSDSAAYGMVLRDSIATGGVSVASSDVPMRLMSTPSPEVDPADLTGLGSELIQLKSGSTASFWLVYTVPAGIGGYRVTEIAAVQDASGNTYIYP